MGWASGTYVAEDIIKSVKEVVVEIEIRKKVYKGVIEALDKADWDTKEEVMGIDPAFDEVLEELYPGWYI